MCAIVIMLGVSLLVGMCAVAALIHFLFRTAVFWGSIVWGFILWSIFH